MFFWELK